MLQDLTPALARQFELKNDHGALVGEVEPDSPAAKAGLKSGDVICEFNGHKVTDRRHLKLEVAETAPGQQVAVEVLRDGSAKTLEVTVKELPGTEQLAAKNSGDDSHESDTLQGVGVSDIDSQARQQLSIPEHVTGAVVTEVVADCAAAEAGLKAGDVILEINHHPVKSAADAVRLTEHAKSKTTLVRVWNPEGSHYLVVDESKAG